MLRFISNRWKFYCIGTHLDSPSVMNWSSSHGLAPALMEAGAQPAGSAQTFFSAGRSQPRNGTCSRIATVPSDGDRPRRMGEKCTFERSL